MRGKKYRHWEALSADSPVDYRSLTETIVGNRQFAAVEQLHYGDHGLEAAISSIRKAIIDNKRIALYADYDVDGTMSCISWIWFLRAIGYSNFTHYIPCRFKEGYGVNLEAVKHLIDERQAQLIITMDTGITANLEAAYCAERGVEFICTDHHLIRTENMPDCIILNPKQHPDVIYQELCGAGITFVLLRALARRFKVSPQIWTDILALTGMATICDMVPLNGVNHKLAKLGISALTSSQRPILRELVASIRKDQNIDESDVGFSLGPRINAVGRLDHADAIIEAFTNNNPASLISYMDKCNSQRKDIQRQIVEQARQVAQQENDPALLFIGGDFHPGVLGVAASRIADEFWCPTFLYNEDKICRGSARAIANFDLSAAMSAVGHLFNKFGGHKAAGGFSFDRERAKEIKASLSDYAETIRAQTPEIWQSRITYDCHLRQELCSLTLLDKLNEMKPFGLGFSEPKFVVSGKVVATKIYNDQLNNQPTHTAVTFVMGNNRPLRIMFFNEVHHELTEAKEASFVVTAKKNTFRNVTSLAFIGKDFAVDVDRDPQLK